MSDNELDTRERIITAALALFAEVGYHKATTRAIAERAAVNEVTIFRQFGNKKSLLEACMQKMNQQSFAETFSHNLTGDYAADIRQMAQAQMQDMLANAETIRIVLCDLASMPEIREVLLAGSRGNAGRIAAYFQQQIDAGIVRSELNAFALTNAFDSLFALSFSMEYIFGGSYTPDISQEEMLRNHIDLFIQGTIKQ